MLEWINVLIDGFVLQLPGGSTYILGFAVGLMTYKIVLLCILGEVCILLTKKKKVSE
jgi:hypothetical protein